MTAENKVTPGQESPLFDPMRAERGGNALMAVNLAELYDEAYCVVGAESFISDLLADLMHFCAFEGIDFAQRISMAEMHYEAEKDGSES
jgi:hypothetical protein